MLLLWAVKWNRCMDHGSWESWMTFRGDWSSKGTRHIWNKQTLLCCPPVIAVRNEPRQWCVIYNMADFHLLWSAPVATEFDISKSKGLLLQVMLRMTNLLMVDELVRGSNYFLHIGSSMAQTPIQIELPCKWTPFYSGAEPLVSCRICSSL